jgi:hypothetical protein
VGELDVAAASRHRCWVLRERKGVGAGADAHAGLGVSETAEGGGRGGRARTGRRKDERGRFWRVIIIGVAGKGSLRQGIFFYLINRLSAPSGSRWMYNVSRPSCALREVPPGWSLLLFLHVPQKYHHVQREPSLIGDGASYFWSFPPPGQGLGRGLCGIVPPMPASNQIRLARSGRRNGQSTFYIVDLGAA